jgi:hypothetical protein
MQRTALALAAIALGAATGASAQDGLGGVTMRVLDDVSEVDAVVIDLGAQNAEQRREGGEAREADTATDAEPERDAGADAAREEERREQRERIERDAGEELERRERALEDRDVERVPAPAAPNSG